MKKFLISVLIWMLPIVIICIWATFQEWAAFENSVAQPCAIGGIIGDSHAQYDVNPEYIPGLANFAQRTTQPMVWRAKMSTILDENPQFSFFIVELWPRVYMINPDVPAKERAEFALGCIPEISLLDVMRSEAMGGIPDHGFSRSYIRGVIFPAFKRVFGRQQGSGLQEGYRRLDHLVSDMNWTADDIRNVSKVIQVPSGREYKVKREICDVLEMIRARRIKIVILTAPLWPKWCEYALTDANKDFFVEEISQLACRYDALWLDMSTTMPNDEDWADEGHLNTEGATKFSKKLYEELVAHGVLK